MERFLSGLNLLDSDESRQSFEVAGVSEVVEPTPAQLNQLSRGDSVQVKTLAFGSNGLLFAVHLVINGTMLSKLYGDDGATSRCA